MIRGKVYELLVNCIPPDIIVEVLLKELLKQVTFEDLKPKLIQWVAHYENKM